MPSLRQGTVTTNPNHPAPSTVLLAVVAVASAAAVWAEVSAKEAADSEVVMEEVLEAADSVVAMEAVLAVADLAAAADSVDHP